MALTPEDEWSLVVCGLIAHADGVLDGDECDRLLGMLTDDIDADTYSDWLSLIGDPVALQAKLDALPAPAADKHRDLLEQAWSMAMADGDRDSAEVAKLAEIAMRFGVDPVQLDFWREAWTSREREFAELAAEAAAVVVAGTNPIAVDDKRVYEGLVDRLPTDANQREQLQGKFSSSRAPVADLGSSMASISRRRRMQLLRLVAPLAHDCAKPQSAVSRFVGLVLATGLSGTWAQKALEDAR